MKHSEITPLRDNMLIRLETPQPISPGGIWMPIKPEDWSGNTRQGIILAKGPEVDDELEVGTYIAFLKPAGNRVYCDDEKQVYRMVRDDDVLYVLEN